VAQGVPPEQLFAAVTEEVGQALPIDTELRLAGLTESLSRPRPGLPQRLATPNAGFHPATDGLDPM
jgi:hypothetical protein